MIKKLKNTLIIFFITLILLELVSFLCLKLLVNNQSADTAEANYIPLSVFKKTTVDGSIKSTPIAVNTLKKNYQSKWSSKEFNVSVDTNSEGFRNKSQFNLADVDIAFFGDSFTFGHGVEEKERFSDIVANYFLEDTIANFAYVAGFQPEHYEYYIRNNQQLKPKHLIVGLYLGNDLESDINETYYNRASNKIQLLYRKVNNHGVLKNKVNLYVFPINRLIDYSAFVELSVRAINKTRLRYLLYTNDAIPNSPNSVDLELGKTKLKNNRAIVALKNIDSIVNARDGRLTVLLIPQNYFFSDINPHINYKLADSIAKVTSEYNLYKQVKQELVNLKIDYLDPLSTLEKIHYFDIDGHWNTLGHQIIGDTLAKKIKN